MVLPLVKIGSESLSRGGLGVAAFRRRDGDGYEVCCEIPIVAPPATVFGLLTDERQMSTWLAQDVKADPQTGGIFRLADASGLWVQGLYTDVIVDRLVMFTWGGIEGLGIGQSVVRFTLDFNNHTTAARLCHSRLPDAAIEIHRMAWRQLGLPKLKAIAEGGMPKMTLLADVADARERYPYATRVHIGRSGQSGDTARLPQRLGMHSLWTA